MILLSIIIPAFKVEKYISKCLESIYSQSVNTSDFEVIVVNDGSPDKSLIIAEEFAGKYSNMTVLSQENQGLSAARNTGLKSSKGKYVWFVDSDDWIAEGSLCRILNQLKHTHCKAFVYKFVEYNEKGEKTGRTCFEQIDTNRIVSNTEALKIARIGLAQLFIIEKEHLCLKELFFLPGIYHEDMEFIPRLMASLNEVYFINDPVYCYLRREGSITSVPNIKRATDYWKILVNIDSLSSKNKGSEISSEIERYQVLILRCFMEESQSNRFNIDVTGTNYKKLFVKTALLGFKYGTTIKDKFKFILLILHPNLYQRFGW